MTQTFFQSTIPFEDWDLDLLIDYVLKFHHRNIRKNGEELAIRLNSLAASPHPTLLVCKYYFLILHYCY